jgi:ring-1,2-phenylacetyl-CoA epoxidase subunit PaaC
MATTSISFEETPLLALTLRLADDALVLGHRLSEWSSKAPLLEEDIALSNIALDLIGQARMLYSYAADQMNGRLSEDGFAFLRDCHQYRNCLLVEQPNGDFAATMVRQVLFSSFMVPYWESMTTSTDETLSAIAAKAAKECAYHLRHASEWLIRLGDGTAESHGRSQRAVDDLWMFTGELFEADEKQCPSIEAGVAPDPSVIHPKWLTTISRVFREATLDLPPSGWMQTGGRCGKHSEHLGHLLAEMQSLPRTYPGASW